MKFQSHSNGIAPPILNHFIPLAFDFPFLHPINTIPKSSRAEGFLFLPILANTRLFFCSSPLDK